MSSIGPQLPPHLTKRKRTPDDDAAPGSPAAKVRATEQVPVNDDEVALDSDSDDDYGPTMPKSTNTSRSSIGPTLPPSNTDQVASDSNNDDDAAIGPSAPRPPPTTTTRPSIGPTLPPSTNTDEIPLDSNSDSDSDTGPAPAPAPAPAPKRTIQGPSAPPALLSTRPATSPPPSDPNSDSGSDSDSDYGPALPTSTAHQHRASLARAAAHTSAPTGPAPPKRDEWMVLPPTASGYRAPDPTKLKARKFASGPRSSAPSSEPTGGISSIWTETPEEKRRRLEDAVLGRGGSDSQPQSTGASGSGEKKGKKRKMKTAEELAQEDRIQKFTEATRGRSLYAEHQQRKDAGGKGGKGGKGDKGGKGEEEEEEDDPSKRAFDKEKDMKLGGRIGTAQRRELLNKAADFGGRFAKGKYL